MVPRRKRRIPSATDGRANIRNINPHVETAGTDAAVGPVPQALTCFESSVNAPFRAKTRPDVLAPVVKVMLVRARMFPARLEPVPSVAELPTCQNRLQPEALFVKKIRELEAVVNVLPILKTKEALGSPRPSRNSVPVNWAEVEKQ